ncbi:hypothetical protein HNR42_002602 [Deinobacterium chartae]|uniref:Roadblock/LAMTOR2 domain-containing protein n=1 Tax=Deinobacterium chartae TaxID=521158 RepID=A0A841I277_9DEIO|nr:roadblock/LC7 domain-containing protein [Deinobacterium chartae]MBB6099166.1 hypothetical protein [Deinobacterium chartae]
MSKQAQLQASLERLRSALPELRGALIATTDGLSIAHALGANVEPSRMSAMAATALGLGKRITSALSAGHMTETSVTGTDGQVFIYAAGEAGVLAILAPHGTNVGLIHLEARDVAREIAALLGGVPA